MTDQSDYHWSIFGIKMVDKKAWTYTLADVSYSEGWVRRYNKVGFEFYISETL